MKTPTLILWSAAVLFFSAATLVGGDDRAEPVDIIIALDKSLSMEEEIEAVKQYVNSNIIDARLQNGDFFLIVAFFGKSQVVVSDFIQGDDHKLEIKKTVDTIAADGEWTDIGNALDKLKAEVEKRSQVRRPKTLLLITDGKHEPPPSSKYHSPQGWASHEYMKATTETQKKGWKIIVLGLGDESQESAKELAQTLGGQYTEAGKGTTSEKLAEIVPDITGTVTVTGKPFVSPVHQNGKTTLSLVLTTKLFPDPLTIVIDAIDLTADGMRAQSILPAALEVDLPESGDTNLVIPINLAGGLQPGSYRGNLAFSFSSKERFGSPLPVEFQIKTVVQSYLWLIVAAAALALGLVALLVLILRKASASNRVAFHLIVREHPLPKGKDAFTAKEGKDLYLKESMELFDITDTRVGKSIAKLAIVEGVLTMTVLKQDRYPELKTPTATALNREFLTRTESGKDFHVRFSEEV